MIALPEPRQKRAAASDNIVSDYIVGKGEGGRTQTRNHEKYAGGTFGRQIKKPWGISLICVEL